MAITRVSSGSGVGTTAAINTTGANLLVLLAAYDSGATVSDSNGNTWIGLTARVDGGLTTRLYYCVSPAVGAGHTATVSIGYGAIALLAYAGADVASVFDGQNGSDGTGALLSGWGVPSFTPGNANELLVFGAAFGNSGGGSLAVDAGFTVRQTLPAVSGTSYGLGAADLIQTTAAAVAPNFTWSSPARVATVLAAFKAAAVTAATAVTLSGPSSGTVGVASSAFTVGANGTITGTVTVTPSDGGAGGTFTPTSVAISAGTPVATFTYTAATTGAKTISVTNSGGLTNPSSITFTAGAVTGLTAAVIASNGQSVALTFATAVTPATSEFTVRVGGVIVRPTAITGAGTSWTLAMGLRWLLAGQTVTVQYLTGTPVTASNGSIISTRSTRHVGRQFGLFIHWGLETYDPTDIQWSDGAVAASFWAPTSPITTIIDQWIACAQAAGMRYIVLTAKHHSGFCLWPSASTTYDVASTPWYSANGSPDVVRIFVQRVRAAGLGVGLYLSPWDRSFERNNSGYTPAAYQAHIQTQLTELLTQYGPIDLMWFDGWNWAASSDGVSLSVLPFASVFTYARNLQPQCALIVNNHQGVLFGTGSDNASDLLEYEGGTLGAQVPSGNLLPAEECDTIDSSGRWFWKAARGAPDSAATVAASLVRINSRNCSFLLNCGPDPSGLIVDADVRVLADVGATRAEAILGATTWHATGAQRTVTVTLTTDGTTPAASLSGLRWAFYDTPNPGRHERPVGQGIASTNGSGVLSVVVFSTLAPGGIGWLSVTNSDGTIPGGTGASGFSGPVAVS